MNPAFSVIFFTSASGAGFGLLFLLGIFGPLGLLPSSSWFGVVAFAASFGLAVGGLISSTFHLGHPERAWRAFSQWRTSWLSREGVASVLTFVPAGLFAIGWVFFGSTGGIWAVLGLVSAVMAAITVYCTAMIYVSLKPIQRWSNGWVAPGYLLISLMTGALLLDLLLHLFGAGHWLISGLALVAVAAAWAVKTGYWRFIERTASASTPESATGLGAFGRVRLLEAPHTEENYLLKEMGFRIARKHAARLRDIAELCGFAAPLMLAGVSLISLALEAHWLGTLAALAAVLAAAVGVVVDRWLFFAEARHAVTLYYGAAEA